MSNLAMMMGLGSGSGGVTFVGSNSGKAPNAGAVTVDLSSIDIKGGDLILVGHFVGEDAAKTSDMSPSSSGYTEITSLYANDTYDTNMKTYGKFADGTETSFVANSVGGSTSSVAVIVSVFRNVSDLPVDAATGLATSGTNTNTDDIVWPEITSVSSGEHLVYFGATGHVSGTRLYTQPDDLSGFVTIGENDDEDITAGFGYKVIDTETSFTANTWTMSGGTSASSVAYTVFKL